jgi:hypothetical protein
VWTKAKNERPDAGTRSEQRDRRKPVFFCLAELLSHLRFFLPHRQMSGGLAVPSLAGNVGDMDVATRAPKDGFTACPGKAWHRQPSRQSDWLKQYKQTRRKPESAP